MTIPDERLDEVLAASAPAEVHDESAVRAVVARVLGDYRVPARSPRRPLVVGAIVGGALLVGTTAAALPSIFGDFGRIDYQSSQEYTVDGRGPFRCEFAFRVDPPAEGKSLQPSTGGRTTSFEEILAFVRTHDWAFDDEPVSLTTPSDARGTHRDLGVMADFISESWQAEVEAEYPGWLASVGEINEAGRCLAVADGSAP